MQKIPPTEIDDNKLTDWKKLVAKELRSADRATISMWRCGFFGRMPPSHSITSFGIDSIEHVLSIQWCIINHKITPKILDDLRKNGKGLTKLIVNDNIDNPHRVIFSTIWDI